MLQPDEIYGPLFAAVQGSGIFPDSKTFVDSRPRIAPGEIVDAYVRHAGDANFDLRAFVESHFVVPSGGNGSAPPSSANTMENHIHELWKYLERPPQAASVPGDSLIPLRRPYIVPGGRFREMYYWDSYFTMLGLAIDGRIGLIGSMVQNFADLIDICGHIPNGNRNYFVSRSQPPFFALMVRLLAESSADDDVLVRFLPAMRKEYNFWMDLEEGSQRYRRCVVMPDGSMLNRYWDDRPLPRPESYMEDVELARSCRRDGESLFRDLRAACESGWDFSSRWCSDPHDLSTIHTTSIIPVDLNCLMYLLEETLALAYARSGREEDAGVFSAISARRKSAINTYLWNSSPGFYCDLDLRSGNALRRESLASAYPLFAGIATPEKANTTAARIREAFLAPGGLRTTLVHSGQQWDAPNGWAPLQWVAYQGCRDYGFSDLADEIAARWVANCRRVFNNTGKMMEKYNVEDLSLPAGGGEYPVQDGFGWTNGVVLAMLKN